MLTGDLLRVRVTQKDLRPAFVDLKSPKVLERADALVALFREGVGSTRGELKAEVEGLIGDGLDVKVVRGLAKVLEDKAEWTSECPVPPEELRRAVYEAVGKAPGRAAAAAAWAALSQQHLRPVEELQALMFADRKDEQALVACPVPDGAWLLQRYNVALVQAALLRSESLEVVLKGASPERLTQLFRSVKFHGLMFRVLPEAEGVRLVLDGPASLVTHSTRYGLALAAWFPALLLQTCAWTLKAELRWGERRLRKTMTLGHELGLRSHYRDIGAYTTRTEQWFQERFEALKTDWTLSREGAPINLGGEGVICPDFTFRKGERVAHLEIIGFWRKDWLQRRITLLSKHGPGNLILAVSSKLDCAKGGITGFAGKVVSFKEIVPAKDVLAAVEAIAKGPPAEKSPAKRSRAKA